MPTLPLPKGGSYLGRGALPVVSKADVDAVLPAFLHPDDPAPVRDAIAAALTQILLRYQQRSMYAVGQADRLNATGVYLTEAWADFGIFRQAGELDPQLLARGLTSPLFVTPQAILSAANTILAPFTSVQAVYYESLADRWYVRSTNTVVGPRSYLSSTHARIDPDNPERLYPSAAPLHNGFSRPRCSPGGAKVFSDSFGRYFVLVVPDLGALNAQGAFVYDGTPLPSYQAKNALFIGAGTDQGNAGYIRKSSSSDVTVYSQIIDAVNRVKGASIRWMFRNDPYLTA